MNRVAAFRLAARLARREVVKRPWRTALVALLVAVPVAGMTMAVAFVRTDDPRAAADWRRAWGEADFVQQKLGSHPTPAALPAGSRIVSWRSISSLLRTVEPRHRALVEVSDVPMTESMGDQWQVTRGRVPTAANEVFLSRDAARELGADVGDELRLDKPGPLSLRVTGVGEKRAYWGSLAAVVGPGTPFPWTMLREPPFTNHAIDLPPATTRTDVRRVMANGEWRFAPWFLPGARWPAPDVPGVAWSWVLGAVVLTVVGIVIASAFAAGARRQLATLGQLSANGATPATLRRVLFLQGTWSGAIGVGVGLVLGTAGLAVLAPHADRLLGRDVDPWIVHGRDLVPIALLGVAAATIAALIPARATSRIPALAAMAGRRPLARVPRWVTAAGAATSLGGLGLLGLAVLGGSSRPSNVWALAAVAGGVALLLGACGMAPGYTSVLEPLGTRLHGSWRLAARSLARQRTRTSALVAAVCASGALAVGASALGLSADAHKHPNEAEMRDDEVHLTVNLPSFAFPRGTSAARSPLLSTPASPPPEFVAAIEAAMPGAERMPLTVVGPSKAMWTVSGFEPERPAKPDTMLDFQSRKATRVLDEQGGSGSTTRTHNAVVFDAPAARVYDLRPEHRAGLERDGALLLGSAEGRGTIEVSDGVSSPTASQSVVVADAGRYAHGALPQLLLSPPAAQRLGFVPEPGVVVLRQSQPLSPTQRAAVADAAQDAQLDYLDTHLVPEQTVAFRVNLSYPHAGLDPLLLEAVLTGASLLFSLFVVTVGLALAAAETRDERDVLTVVGAPPSAMRAASGQKAAILVALGALLAIPVGFLPVVVYVLAELNSMPLVFPWRVAGLLLVAVPLVAGAATTLGSAVALRLRPVRISTMAFD